MGRESWRTAERARMAAGRAQVLLIFTVVWSITASALPLTAAVEGKVGSLRSDGTPGALTIPPHPSNADPCATAPRRDAPRRAAPTSTHPLLRTASSQFWYALGISNHDAPSALGTGGPRPRSGKTPGSSTPRLAPTHRTRAAASRWAASSSASTKFHVPPRVSLWRFDSTTPHIHTYHAPLPPPLSGCKRRCR